MYTTSRLQTLRRPTIEVTAGAVGIGAHNPIRIQSMTTSDTQDVEATVRQSIALAEVGCEIVRVTAPNVPAAQCLKAIRQKLTAAGFGHIPLVADIHFLPSAAMEAVEHVEKIRVNPGNYADKKKFAVKEYSDADYVEELERLHEAFSPLVLRCKALGRAMRIGTNHGSLSDRIMNRYGDTPLGMVESALEFLRIAESHSYRNIVLSMKASNPKVMIQAYRLLVERMAQENMHYPLHLGVTEAGDGEDGRIKSAIGIGSLLLDGLGDTIRVSLTEDSVYEIPVARALADKAMSQWQTAATPQPALREAIDPYRYTKRATAPCELHSGAALGGENPPRVIVRTTLERLAADVAELSSPRLIDTPAEGLLVTVNAPSDLAAAEAGLPASAPAALLFELPAGASPEAWRPALRAVTRPHWLVLSSRSADGAPAAAGDFARRAAAWAGAARPGAVLALEVDPAEVAGVVAQLREHGAERAVFSASPGAGHTIGRHRALAAALEESRFPACIWIRTTKEGALRDGPDFLSRLLEASILTGTLLCDGVGDAVSIETEPDAARALRLAYNVLQGAGARISKTEFVACPSCGRTLFDLQTTTQRIRAQTGHLKGVKLAIMGCIVNGPGEMADADFGYVGGAPGKINLYVGKTCVQYNIPQAEADARLIALIKEHGKWTEPTVT